MNGCLDFSNSFLLSLKLSHFSVFSPILILSKNKTHLFCNASFLYWISCWYFFLWCSLISSFSSFHKFLYRFFDFSFIASLFFEYSAAFSSDIFFFCFLQDLLFVKLVIAHFYTLICWVNKIFIFCKIKFSSYINYGPSWVNYCLKMSW